MKSASRTLVKSPPELWELIDQPERMHGLMCGLVGRATEVTVDEREPESVLRWQASDDGTDAWIEVQLAEKGWGTNVKVKAENAAEPTKLEGWLDAVLEELATPQKRPFEGMAETPSGTVVDAMVAKPAAPEKPRAEEAPAGEPAAAQPPRPAESQPQREVQVPVTPAPMAPKPDRRGLLRKIFGF
jgi:hypothetical protein